jgi:hypothetical protein
VPYSLRRERRLQLAVGQRFVDEGRRQPFEELDLAVEECEPLGLAFLDDVGLDARRNRELLALERRRGGQRLRGHGPRRHVPRVPVARIGDEHDLRAAFVFAELVGPGAHRMRAEVEPVRLDDLARHGRRVRHRKRIEKAQIGCTRRIRSV